MYKDSDGDAPALVCVVGKTTLKYHQRAVEDLHTTLVERGDWVELGTADEQRPAKDGTLEGLGSGRGQPGGRVVLPTQGLPGRLQDVSPPLEHLGLAEPRHSPRNNRVRAK